MRRNGGLTLSSVLQVPLTKYSSLQDLGDIRQLIVCFKDHYSHLYDFAHSQTLNKALQDVVKETEGWAQQYEADGRYKDAAYLHGRIRHDLTEENQILPNLAAVYEKIGDYPAAELAQEKLLRIMLAEEGVGTNVKQVREVETLSRLLNLFHSRLQVLGSASQIYAKLSIVYRAAVLDLEQLNAALLDQGLIALDYLDQMKFSSLHIAAKKNALNLARLLLERGANLNLKDDVGDIPLHLAVGYETEEMVELLLNWGADTEIKDKHGRTPIQIASSRGRSEPILLNLIIKGAKIETRSSEERTPLGTAIDCDSPLSARMLIEHGADVNAEYSLWNHGGTLLLEAVKQKKEWAVKLLLEEGANPQAIDGAGRQALHYAVEAGQESMVKVLLEHDGIQHVTVSSMFKFTLLHLAVFGGNLTIIEMILKAGADTNEQDFLGDTSLHELINRGTANFEQIFDLLLKFGAQVNMGNNNYATPLHLAASHCRPEAVLMLLDAGADPYLVNRRGETALNVAQKWCRHDSDPRYKQIQQMLSSHIAANSRGASAGY